MPTLRLAVTLAAFVAAALPVAARGLIRDAEIEATLGRIAAPLFRAAAINPSSVHIYIVDDPEANAFVAGGQNIFLHTGMLTELDSLDQLRAVIAHELGHITGGHLIRRDQGLQGARGIAAIGMIGAAAAVVAGAPEAGIAIATGGAQAAHRSALAYSRSEEASADQAGLRYLAASGSDPRAAVRVLSRFRGQEALMLRNMDPYAVSHPLWGERISLLEEKANAMPPGSSPSEEDVYWHARMRAKLEAFLDSPAQTLRRYPPSETSEPAAYARAIAYERRPDIARGRAAIAGLIASRPEDPYYQELDGQFLLESGKAEAAAAAYRRAVALTPKEPLLLAGLGRSLLNMNDSAVLPEARDVLARAAAMDGADAGVLRDLALAEARLGNEGAAALATAERMTLEGRFRDAERSAARASALLPEGSPGWRRAQDLTRVVKSAQKK